jgi:gamma-glutamyltranspeptidase
LETRRFLFKKSWQILESHSKNGEKGFYEGKNAQLLVRRNEKGNGIILSKTLKTTKPKKEKFFLSIIKTTKLFLCRFLQVVELF